MDYFKFFEITPWKAILIELILIFIFLIFYGPTIPIIGELGIKPTIEKLWCGNLDNNIK